MSPVDRLVLRRFALKCVALAIFSIARPPSRMLSAAIAMFSIAAVLNASLALVRRERFSSITLTYWDEVAMCIFIATCLELFAR